MPTLHVVVPVYEERATLEECLRRVRAARLPAGWGVALTIVDDGSSAASVAEMTAIAERVGATMLRHERNRGKGAALRTGFASALERADDADAVIVQDADLEYEPDDFAALLAPIVAGRVDAVFGDRWRAAGELPLYRRLHRSLNAGLTLLSNAASGLRVSDMECCYKVFRVPLLRRILPLLTEDRFGVEPQIAAILGRRRVPVEEVGVRYSPRGFSEGKKIRPRDGVRALWVILRERWRRTEEA